VKDENDGICQREDRRSVDEEMVEVILERRRKTTKKARADLREGPLVDAGAKDPVSPPAQIRINRRQRDGEGDDGVPPSVDAP
jgi:hypothetical protein